MVDDPTPSTSHAPPRNHEIEDLQEIIGQHQQQLTIEEMLEEDEEQEEPQATREDDVKSGEPTTCQLTEMLTTIACLSEQLEEYNTRPHAQNYICPVIDKVLEEYKALYKSRVNAYQRALITRYLHKAQPVITALANITLEDDDGTTYNVIEMLGDLLVEELPQDFEGFDA
ncbi:hypothetical protein Hamer_G012616 [Homarus americanus]|uniref:Uncharacterized protein n=1 Tax=Homarus americanus TaxID=6706 RepID=A0A8J5JKA5_HOMAM|nr:hypothetical protein Hamer_G012616 [Homarus americanus]